MVLSAYNKKVPCSRCPWSVSSTLCLLARGEFCSCFIFKSQTPPSTFICESRKVKFHLPASHRSCPREHFAWTGSYINYHLGFPRHSSDPGKWSVRHPWFHIKSKSPNATPSYPSHVIIEILLIHVAFTPRTTLIMCSSSGSSTEGKARWRRACLRGFGMLISLCPSRLTVF